MKQTDTSTATLYSETDALCCSFRFIPLSIYGDSSHHAHARGSEVAKGTVRARAPARRGSTVFGIIYFLFDAFPIARGTSGRRDGRSLASGSDQALTSKFRALSLLSCPTTLCCRAMRRVHQTHELRQAPSHTRRRCQPTTEFCTSWNQRRVARYA